MNTVTILDGGMGQELTRRSKNPPSSMWSAGVLLEEAPLVEALHREYIDAGADVITLASYSVTPERLGRDADIALFEPLQAAACKAALRAREQSSCPGVRIAGSLPPLVASYHTDVQLPDAESIATYRRIVASQQPSVDLLICETMASISQARSAATAALESGLPVWVALTVDDAGNGALRSGEPIGEAVGMLEELGVQAILLNCSTPEAITASWPSLAKSSLPIGAYANAFESVEALAPGGTVDALSGRTDLGPDEYARRAQSWIDGGASIVGGCCETTPEHIRKLHSAFACSDRH